MEPTKAPPPDRNLRAPKLKLPAGACDCHFHIYGPQTRFPLKPGRESALDDCTLDDVIALQRALGLSRGVITQSFQHGHSYEYMIHALTSYPQRFRGVTAPASDVTDGELRILAQAGVVGMRFAVRSTPQLDVHLARRGVDLGWHNHFFFSNGNEIAAWRDRVLALPGNFVIDGLGNPPTDRGLDSPEFCFVLECLDTGRCWVKLTPRFSKDDTFPFADTLPFIREVINRYPARVLWGSDWPHPGYYRPMPNDADLVDLVVEWTTDVQVQQRLFVDNPAELFGFTP